MKRVCFSALRLGEIMEENPDWPALLTDYQAAAAEFDRVTEKLTLLLADRTTTAEDFRGLFEAEAQARDMVVLTRMRLMNAWRDSQPHFQLPITVGDLDKQL